MTKRRLLVIVLSLAVCFSVSGCRNQDGIGSVAAPVDIKTANAEATANRNDTATSTGSRVAASEATTAPAPAAITEPSAKPSPKATAEPKENDPNVVKIKDNMFMLQCNDILLNPLDYKDKIIKLEGIYRGYTDKNGVTTNYVYRRTPGCCGADGEIGFLFNYDGEMPKQNDWIKIEGTVFTKKNELGYLSCSLNLTKLDVSSERGAEFVTQ